MSSAAEKLHSPAEYLALQRAAEHKSEYADGYILAMVGATRRHNLIAGNVFGELRAALRGRPCETYVNDMRVKVEASGRYFYPDVTALCEEPRFEDDHGDTLLNPAVVVEVLSGSTEAYDRGEKFAHYRRLGSLQEYVLVAQDKVRVEHYARREEGWLLTELSDPEDTLELESLGCGVGLREIYERVSFAEGEEPSSPG